MRILRCRFPFPPQDPPVQMPEPCSAKCPNYDDAALANHAKISESDPELLEALRSFAGWFYAEGQPPDMIDEQVRFAAELYTRPDHDGTCVPKTVLFMHYKFLQYNLYGPDLKLSENARRALKGEEVACWPDGTPGRGLTWNEMFYGYSLGYD